MITICLSPQRQEKEEIKWYFCLPACHLLDFLNDQESQITLWTYTSNNERCGIPFKEKDIKRDLKKWGHQD